MRHGIDTAGLARPVDFAGMLIGMKVMTDRSPRQKVAMAAGVFTAIVACAAQVASVASPPADAPRRILQEEGVKNAYPR